MRHASKCIARCFSTGETFEYAYDAVGSRLWYTETGMLVHWYEYDAANRLVLSEVEGLTNVDGVAYTWDEAGNLLSDGLRSFTYDAANRLVQVVSGTLTTEFTYNADGVLVAQTVDGVETTFVQDVAGPLTQILVETSGGGTKWHLYGVAGALGWMVVFIVLNGVQFTALRPRGCAHCKRRYTCAGSAAR